MTSYPIPVVTVDRGTIAGTPALGFETVPDLVRNKSRTNGFYLNVLALGRRGTGTTSLINNLFHAKVIDPLRPDDLCYYKAQLLENDICLTISVTTYHKTDFSEVKKYIDDCNAHFYRAESTHDQVLDSRVHVCLYLMPTDKIFDEEAELLRNVSKLCNVVPIIAKADTYTVLELENYRARICTLFKECNFFHPPQYTDDAEFSKEILEFKERYPLAVYASSQEFEIDGTVKKGRLYKHGFLDQEDEENDLGRLRKLIISNHLDDLVSSTEVVYYDKYRQDVFDEEKSARGNDIKIKRIRAEMEKILAERNLSIIAQIEEDIKKLEQEYNSKKSCILLNNERNNLFAKL